MSAEEVFLRALDSVTKTGRIGTTRLHGVVREIQDRLYAITCGDVNPKKQQDINKKFLEAFGLIMDNLVILEKRIKALELQANPPVPETPDTKSWELHNRTEAEDHPEFDRGF